MSNKHICLNVSYIYIHMYIYDKILKIQILVIDNFIQIKVEMYIQLIGNVHNYSHVNQVITKIS